MTDTLKTLRAKAKDLGVTIDAQRDDSGWGFWLLDSDGNGLWADDNFCTSHAEIDAKLDQYAAERWDAKLCAETPLLAEIAGVANW